MDPLVSVIIPSYQRPQRLERAVRSVLRQTYDEIELIIVDDHSPKPVTETLKSSFQTERVHIIRHEENEGANEARTTGMKAASGEFIAFLDDDDEWNPSKIEKQVARASETGTGVVYTWVSQVVNGSVVGGKKANHSNKVTEELFLGDFIGTFSAILMRSDLVDKVGYPDTRFPSWQDWDYCIRLSRVANFEPVSEPLVSRHSEGHDRISDDYWEKKQISANLLLEEHGETADCHDMLNEFVSTIEHRLGSAAMANKHWRCARSHFLSALRRKYRLMTFLYLVSVIGGPVTYYPLRKFRRVFSAAGDSLAGF